MRRGSSLPGGEGDVGEGWGRQAGRQPWDEGEGRERRGRGKGEREGCGGTRNGGIEEGG